MMALDYCVKKQEFGFLIVLNLSLKYAVDGSIVILLLSGGSYEIFNKNVQSVAVEFRALPGVMCAN